MAFKEKLKRLFYGLTQKPTEAEDRLFKVLHNLAAIQDDLELRMLPLPEINVAPAIEEGVVRAWSFDLLLRSSLKEKGWPVGLDREADDVLLQAFNILKIQSDRRISFYLVVKDYKNPHSPYAEGLKFLCDHVSDLEDVSGQLQDFQPEDLGPGHMCEIHYRKQPKPRLN